MSWFGKFCVIMWAFTTVAFALAAIEAVDRTEAARPVKAAAFVVTVAVGSFALGMLAFGFAVLFGAVAS